METDDLIDALVQDGRPVRPLPKPGLRVLSWLLLSLPIVAVVLGAYGLRPDLSQAVAAPEWIAAQVLTLSTAVAAALGALVLTLPGRSSWPVGLAIGLMGLWLMALGTGCIVDAEVMGAAAFRLSPEPECFGLIVLFGLVPFGILLTMTRKGVPLAPSHTLCCSAIAAGALGAFTLGLVHPQPLSFMVLVWQWGSVLVLGGLGWALAPLRHRHTPVRPGAGL